MEHLTLLEFTQTIKKTLEKNLDATYWVVAEIGEIKSHQKGHCYLELIEKENEQIIARMKGTIWSYTYQNLVPWFERIAGSALKEGMKILANVEVQFHEAYGLSVNIRDIDPNYTLGERQKLKQQVLGRLDEEGLLTRNKKLPLPLVPQRIAVVSSKNSAGYEDFLNQLQSSVYQFTVSFFPALLQGGESTRSVVEALKTIFKNVEDYDLVLILRGGGAQADLDSFNTYLMGKAIARFPLPVITGIGHDRDETIADLVAHTKLKTPTAVAEFIIRGMETYEETVLGFYEAILARSQQITTFERNRVALMAQRINLKSVEVVRSLHSSLQLISLKIFSAGGQQKINQLSRIESLSGRINRSAGFSLSRAKQKLDAFGKLFRFSDPAFTLQRGFTYSTINGRPLGKIKEVKPGDEMRTVAEKSKVVSVIKDIEN